MSYNVFVFSRGRSIFLIPAGSLEEAYSLLQRRQSVSLERTKLEYEHIETISENSGVVKIKL